MHTTHDYDVLIIGGGPAGLCAAMYAGRGMLHAAVPRTRGHRRRVAQHREDRGLSRASSRILGRELAERMTAHALKFGAEIRQENVETIDAPGGRHLRRHDLARAISTGPRPSSSRPAARRPSSACPAKLEYAGRGVSYCAVCDGAFFKGETIAVVGGGDAAVEEADYLTRYAAKVYLVHRRDRAPRLADPAGAPLRQSQDRGDLEPAGQRDGRRTTAACSISNSRTRSPAPPRPCP